jgi:molecular chaperone DnaK
MIRDAEANQAADAKRKEAVESRNELDSLIHSSTKTMSEHGDKIDESTKTEFQKAIDEAKAVDANADLDTIKAKISALSTASMNVGKAIYGKKDGAQGEPPKEEVKEAEEVKEKK